MQSNGFEVYEMLGGKAFHNLSPEICLLYKSTDAERNGYQQDFDLVFSKMNFEQKEWFKDSLNIMFPNGHKWN